MSCPDQASGRRSSSAGDALGRAAGRRPTLAGNVSPGDAAPGGERGTAAAAAAAAETVRASAARERTCDAAGGGGIRLGAAGGRWEAGRRRRREGRRRRRGSRSRARRSTKRGAAPLRYRAGPGTRPAGRQGRAACRRPGRERGRGRHGAAGRRGPSLAAFFVWPPVGRKGRGWATRGRSPRRRPAFACPSCRRSCGRELHVGKRRCSSSLAGTGRRGQNRRGPGAERRWRPRCGLPRTS